MNKRLADRWHLLLARAQAAVPGLRASFRVGRAPEFPATRDYAYCRKGPKGITIVVAPKMRRAGIPRIDGVLMHELAHAVLFAAGRPNHTERQADAVAEGIFGRNIYYDRDLVQTTGVGVRPRPRELDRASNPPRRQNGNREHLVKHLVTRCGMTREDADKIAPKKDVKSPRRALSPEQLKRFQAATRRLIKDPGIRTVLLLLPLTGMRIAEACNLPLSAFSETRRGRLKAEVLGKGEKLRTVRMSGKGSALIRDYIRRYRVGDRERGHLFTGPRGGKVTPRQVQVACKIVAEEIGAKGLTPHCLRHTFSTIQVLECRDLQSLRMQLGHGKLDTPRKALRRLPTVTLTYLDF